MIEVFPNLWVGSDEQHKAKRAEMWQCVVLHACKEPYHRQALGYTGRGAPKDHAEYLMAFRPGASADELSLNLIDADDPKYIPPEIIDSAVRFVRDHLEGGVPVLVHCNQGHSRGPVIALLALASLAYKDASFEEAEEHFRNAYPPYCPAAGMYEYARTHWDVYRRGEAVIGAGHEALSV